MVYDPDMYGVDVSSTPPEVRLWQQVLFTGITEAKEAYAVLGCRTMQQLKEIAYEANETTWDNLAWLLDRTTHVGSFIWVCDMLGYDPDVFRSEVLL